MKPPGLGSELCSINRARRRAEAEEAAWQRLKAKQYQHLSQLSPAERDLVLRRTHGPDKPHVWWRLGEGNAANGSHLTDDEVSV
jgi:hypothetical protein